MEQANQHLKRLKQIVGWITQKIGQQHLAIILMVIANLSWPLGFVYVSQHNFSPFQTNLARGIAICISHVFICKFFGISLDFKSSTDIKYLFIRSFLILFHQIIYVSMYFVVPSPIINVISLTGPLFVFILDYYLNGVAINSKQLYGIIIGFSGVLLTVNGQYIIKMFQPDYQIHSKFQNYLISDVRLKVLLSIFTIFTNILWAYAIVIQKKISHVSGIKISYFLGVLFIYTSSVTLSFVNIEPLSASTFCKGVIFSGMVMAMCQILFISALNLTKNAGKMTMLMLLYMVSSYSISLFRYGQKINIVCIIGLVFMGIGLYRTIFNKT